MESFMSCKALKFFIIVGLSIIFYGRSFAQDAADETDTTYAFEDDSTDNLIEITTDTAIVRNDFDTRIDSLQRWKNSRDFSYVTYLDSLLRNEKDLRMDTVSIDAKTGKKRRTGASQLKRNSGNFLNSLPLQIFFWALAIFFIGFIIYKLFLTDGIFSKRNAKAVGPQPGIEPEGLNEYSEYDRLIREAEAKSDYNLSTRYLFLQTLKRLADADLIQYSPDKTNYNYVMELSNKNYRHDFASLTLNYEYVWYGKFVLTPDRYRQLKEQFISFNKKQAA